MLCCEWHSDNTLRVTSHQSYHSLLQQCFNNCSHLILYLVVYYCFGLVLFWVRVYSFLSFRSALSVLFSVHYFSRVRVSSTRLCASNVPYTSVGPVFSSLFCVLFSHLVYSVFSSSCLFCFSLPAKQKKFEDSSAKALLADSEADRNRASDTKSLKPGGKTKEVECSICFQDLPNEPIGALALLQNTALFSRTRMSLPDICDIIAVASQHDSPIGGVTVSKSGSQSKIGEPYEPIIGARLFTMWFILYMRYSLASRLPYDKQLAPRFLVRFCCLSLSGFVLC